jgi:hypothetical protein
MLKIGKWFAIFRGDGFDLLKTYRDEFGPPVVTGFLQNSEVTALGGKQLLSNRNHAGESPGDIFLTRPHDIKVIGTTVRNDAMAGLDKFVFAEPLEPWTKSHALDHKGFRLACDSRIDNPKLLNDIGLGRAENRILAPVRHDHAREGARGLAAGGHGRAQARSDQAGNARLAAGAIDMDPLGNPGEALAVLAGLDKYPFDGGGRE